MLYQRELPIWQFSFFVRENWRSQFVAAVRAKRWTDVVQGERRESCSKR